MTEPLPPAAAADAATAPATASGGRIVVGVDDSGPSRHALQWARFMAQALGTTIDAVTVWEISAVEAEEWVEDWNPETDAAAQLHAIVAEVLGAEPPVTVQEVVRHGAAADELLAASEGAAMLIVGNRGHRGWHELFQGSVSSSSTVHARCPVLVIHGDTPPPPGPAAR
jgi:nucleotide-binding universal stress UspA family protein